MYSGRAARGASNEIERFVDAVVTEIRLRGRPANLASVYLGGGTPSLMSAGQVARVLQTADDAFGVAAGAEITIEVNPAAADRGDICGFAAAGVNRVSIGAQSFVSADLRALGRRHTPDDVVATVALARAAAVWSVSVDLLYDVPGQTIASWRDSLDVALSFEPEHVSAYSLTLDSHDPGGDQLVPSAGARRWRARARAAQDEDRAADMYELADDVLARAGFGWYEISNFARPGHESRHNAAYWSSAPWEAVGPGAHAFDGTSTRRWNAARLDAYLAALEAGSLPPGRLEPAPVNESMILALRTSTGVPREVLSDSLAWAVAHGLVEDADGGNVRLTRRGRLLSNELFARLLDSDEEIAA